MGAMGESVTYKRAGVPQIGSTPGGIPIYDVGEQVTEIVGHNLRGLPVRLRHWTKISDRYDVFVGDNRVGIFATEAGALRRVEKEKASK